jgi:hypothetical protein
MEMYFFLILIFFYVKKSVQTSTFSNIIEV